MKTIVIWDTHGMQPIEFFILKGDYSHLDEVYINCEDEEDGKLTDELNNLIYNDDGQYRNKVYKKFPRKAAMNPDNKVIVAGFLHKLESDKWQNL